MAVTRHATGSSKPRILGIIPTGPESHKSRTTTTKKSTTGRGTKKSAVSTKGGRVAKAPATHHKRKPTLKDKVEGAVEKVVGKVERKPGKEGAGTKKMRGTDGKGSKGRKAKVVA